MTVLRLAAAGLLVTPLFPLAAAAQALDATFASPTGIYSPGQVYALGPQKADGKHVVAGNFSRVNGLAINNLMRLDAAGVIDQAFSSGRRSQQH